MLITFALAFTAVEIALITSDTRRPEPTDRIGAPGNTPTMPNAVGAPADHRRDGGAVQVGDGGVAHDRDAREIRVRDVDGGVDDRGQRRGRGIGRDERRRDQERAPVGRRELVVGSRGGRRAGVAVGAAWASGAAWRRERRGVGNGVGVGVGSCRRWTGWLGSA